MPKTNGLVKDLPFLATRVRQEIHDWVAEEAERNKRTKSAQLHYMLEQIWRSQQDSPDPPAPPSRKGRRAPALAIAAIGAASLFGGPRAEADSRVSTFFRADTAYSVYRKRRKLLLVA